MNSPATRVPSHGLHGWSQTYAVDLVYEPADDTRPRLTWWPPARRPDAFPGFGQPILAPLTGTVVRRRDLMRDHWTRTSVLGRVYFLIESVREFAGPIGILGNHVVIQGDNGGSVVLAHLQRHSLCVDRGDRVRAGDVVARCGNSGNSTEPHLHIQAMDRPSVWIGAALPMRFDGEPPPPTGSALEDHARPACGRPISAGGPARARPAR